MAPKFLIDGPADAKCSILLAHGAGAPMDSPAMTAATKHLAEAGFRVVRFEFGYMASRRTGGRKPPPRAETLRPEYVAAVDALEARGPLVIGGKSMGGRVASMVADELHAAGKIAGLLCLGYPFHPPDKPDQLRTKHLVGLKTPALICQGTRDAFGTPDELSPLLPTLKAPATLHPVPQGDHSFKLSRRDPAEQAAIYVAIQRTIVAWVRAQAP